MGAGLTAPTSQLAEGRLELVRRPSARRPGYPPPSSRRALEENGRVKPGPPLERAARVPEESCPLDLFLTHVLKTSPGSSPRTCFGLS